MFKKLYDKLYSPIKLHSSAMIDATEEEVFDQWFDTKKFTKMLNCLFFFPFDFVTCKSDYHEVGVITHLFFLLPAFYYFTKIRECKRPEYIKIDVGGGITGKLEVIVEKRGDKIFCSFGGEVKGINLFLHLYYKYFLAIPHDLFFMRFMAFKRIQKNILKERKLKAN